MSTHLAPAPDQPADEPRRREPAFTARTETLPENGPRAKDPLLWIWLSGLVLAAAVDVPLATPAFNRVLRSSPAISVLCAIGFAVVTLLAAFSSGREAKRGNVWGSIASGAAVLGLVAGLFVLRLLAADLTSGSALSGLEGASTASAAPDETPIAITMAIFVLAAAVLAWIEGYVLTEDPRTASLRRIGHAIAQHEGTVAVCEAQEARHLEDLATKANDLARVDADLITAQQGLDAFARELQELARVEYAIRQGNPTATSTLDLALPTDDRPTA